MNSNSLLGSICLLAAISLHTSAADPPPDKPLPKGPLARLGHARMVCDSPAHLVVSPDGNCLHREPIEHASDPQELELCRTLAAAVVAALGDQEPSGGDPASVYRPFYLVIGQGEPAPASLTSEVVRAAFRGTLFPDVAVNVTPFLRQPEMIITPAGKNHTSPERQRRDGPAQATERPVAGAPGLCDLLPGRSNNVGGADRPRKPKRHPEPDPWLGFREWAVAHPALREMAEVEIGYGCSLGPCLAAVFPRLVVGLTRAGSLVGACGFIAQA